MTTVADVVAVLERAYPPAFAESWDRVGLVAGDPQAPVHSVLVAVDATDDVVDETVRAGVDLLLVHHPPLLRGVHSIAADTPKGRLLHRLVGAGCALYAAHTNADIARPGVNDALTELLGLPAGVPLVPLGGGTVDRWGVMVPPDALEDVLAAVFAAGAGRAGEYSDCAFAAPGQGRFRPGDAAIPALGDRGRPERVEEVRAEFVAPPELRSAVRRALRAAHPYEEPAVDVVASHAVPTGGHADPGLGRVCEFDEPTTLREFTRHVAERLPRTVWGVRAAGDPETTVRRVAVCSGAGESAMADARRAGADVYLTGDLRHHVADEFLREGGPALVDAAHWALESPWCAAAAELLARELGVRATASALRTDPWTVGAGSLDPHEG